MTTNLPDRRPAEPATALDRLSQLNLDRRTYRGLSRLRAETALRVAAVQAEGIVTNEKLHEIDSSAREATTGQAMLFHYRMIVAAGDPLLADDLRYFADLAKIGKGEVIADQINAYCRESRSR